MEKKFFLFILIISMLLPTVFIFSRKKDSADLSPSRKWMEYSMIIVRKEKPTPPTAARFYAYVTSVYYDVLTKTNDVDQANVATAKTILLFYPDAATSTEGLLDFLKMQKGVSPNLETQKILKSYEDRLSQDKKQAITPRRLYGMGNWTGENPMEPSAGSWQRWIVEKDKFKVPPPPEFGSREYMDALNVVKNSMSLTNKQADAIKFWGGAPGTETPAGIWQNQLLNMTKELHLSNREYAYSQKVLAQTIADAFLECWEIKYTFWTKRPNMADPSIKLIWMNNPNFPSYLSGHATVSFAAAEVLSRMFPQYTNNWFLGAEEAKNSRLWAGIHFPFDLESGKELGKDIGQSVIKELNLAAVK